MPSFVVGALITAGVSTGAAYIAGSVVAAGVQSFFLASFGTALVLGGISNELPKRVN